jgi:hypothetical protein
VSTNDEFILCLEELLANAFSILITRGRIGINPVVFLGEKVCPSLQVTLAKLREISTVVKERPEFIGINPTMTAEWELYQMSIAEEFRSLGYLHPAFQWDDQDHSSDNLTMEEFFSTDRLQKCERNYCKYIGTKLLKQLMQSPDDYNCRPIRYLSNELLSNTVLASLLSLLTPLNINIWIDMGISYLPMFSESVLKPTEVGDIDSTSQVEQSVRHSESHELHLEFSAHFVGAIGLETVSSSCCVSTQEAAAAIVFREGCQLAPEDTESSSISVIDYSNDCGKFIIRKCEFQPFGAGTGVLCLSYIRPSQFHSTETKDSRTDWLVLDTQDALTNQAKLLRSIFEDPKHMSVPLVLSDSVVGHIFFLAQRFPQPQDCFEYSLLGVTHSADLPSVATEASPQLKWKNFEQMVQTLFPSLVLNAPINCSESSEGRGSPMETVADMTPPDAEDLVASVPLEESFLREQRRLFCFFELTGALDEFLHGDTTQGGDGSETLLSSIKLLTYDQTKMKSFRRVVGALRNIVIDGISPKWIEAANRSAQSAAAADLPLTSLLDNVSSLYSLSMTSVAVENVVVSPDDLNLVIWSAFVISRCQMTPKDWENVTDRQPSGDSEDPCCLLCGDRKCYLLADSSVRNYPLNREENKFIRELKLDILTDQLDPNDVANQYDFLVYILYISGAYGLLYSVVNILAVLLNPSRMVPNHGSAYEIITQRLHAPHHWIYLIQQCWVENAIMKSAAEAGQVLDLLSPLDRVSIFISPMTDPLIQTPKTPQKIGIGKTVGLKLEKALAAATRVFADTGSDDDHDAVPLPPLPDRDRDRDRERDREKDRDRDRDREKMESQDDHDTNSRVSFLTESGRSLSNKGQMLIASLSSLEDSLANTASNLTVAAPPPPYLTFTSPNADIIEIFRMRKQTADDKWDQKNSSSSTTKSTAIRRAEATFKISILLRDRPSPMFLESRRLILPREDVSPPMYWVEINKSERLTQNWMLYTISVFRTQSGLCLRHNPHSVKQKFELFSIIHTKESAGNSSNGNGVVDDLQQHQQQQQESSPSPSRPPPACICRCWEVKRRYSDFDDFHKHLKTQVGSDALQKLRLPAKNYLKVVQSQHFIEKRMKGLQDYLRAVLLLIPGSSEVEIFLEEQAFASDAVAAPVPSVIEPHSPHLEKALPPISEEETTTMNSSSSSDLGESKDPSRQQRKLFRLVNSVITKPKGTQSSLQGNSGTGEKSDSPNVSAALEAKLNSSSSSSAAASAAAAAVAEEMPKDGNDKIDSSKFPVIEERMFSLINELLEVDDMTVMKKKIVSLAMRSVRLLFRTSMANWMQHQSKVSLFPPSSPPPFSLFLSSLLSFPPSSPLLSCH